MTYSQALSQLSSGFYARRTSWAAPLYIGQHGNQVYLYGNSPGGVPYTATEDDQTATNWISGGDQPPK